MTAASLVALSLAVGLIAGWVFRHTTDLASLGVARRRLFAHLLEFRLFYDEPRLIWRAQAGVIRENVRLIRLLVVPLVIVSIPMTLLLIYLEPIFGFRALRAGETAVITARTDQPLARSAPLQAPPGTVVETPPVKIARDHEIAWRVRDLEGGRKNLRFILAGQVMKVDYPKADVSIAGLNLSWIAWFFLVSSAAALCAITLRS